VNHLAYVDTSAFIKLLLAEPETPAIRTALRGWPNLVASEILFIEAHRVGMREHRQPDVANLLQTVTLLSLTPTIRQRSATIGTARLRTLDAIHLATAETLGGDLGIIFTYDRRMLSDAPLEGLPVRAPAPTCAEVRPRLEDRS